MGNSPGNMCNIFVEMPEETPSMNLRRVRPRIFYGPMVESDARTTSTYFAPKSERRKPVSPPLARKFKGSRSRSGSDQSSQNWTPSKTGSHISANKSRKFVLSEPIERVSLRSRGNSQRAADSRSSPYKSPVTSPPGPTPQKSSFRPL